MYRVKTIQFLKKTLNETTIIESCNYYWEERFINYDEAKNYVNDIIVQHSLLNLTTTQKTKNCVELENNKFRNVITIRKIKK